MPDMEAELTAAQDAYLANADYWEVGSVAKARAYVTACKKLAMLIPTMSSQGSRHALDMRENLRQLPAQERAAQDYVAANSDTDGGGLRHFDVSRFRE